MLTQKLSPIPVVMLMVSIVATVIFGVSESVVFNPPYLLLILNLIFWTGATIAIAYISAKTFLHDGSLTVLLISVSIIILGVSVILSGWVGSFSGDHSVAIGNICPLVASVVQLTSGLFSLTIRDEAAIARRKRLLFVAYAAALVFVGVVSVIVLSGSLPPFFTSSGPTLLRQSVLGSTVLFFGLALTAFVLQYAKSRSPVLLWYSLAIALFSLGFFSAFEIHVIGDVPTWLGRVTLYTGNLYLLAALLESRKISVGTSNGWAEAFRSQRGQIETLFSKMLNGFAYHRIIVDEEGNPVDYVFLAANEAFEKMTGLKREIVIGKKVTEVLPGIEKDPADWIGAYGKVALTGQPAFIENYVAPLRRWYSVSAYSPRKDYFVAISEDITERKRAEKEIASLAKFPLENPAAVLRVDQKGIILFANPVAYGFLKEWQTKVGERVPENIKQQVIDALASGTKIEFEANLGEETFSFLVAPIAAEGYVNLYGISITKRKKAEKSLEEYVKNLKVLVAERTEKLEASALYARSLIEASLDPLVTISAEGKITDVNKATELATGFNRDQLIGSDFSDYFTEPEKARAGYKHVFTQGFVKDYSLAIRHKSGKITDVLYNATLYRNEAGEIQGVFAAARDVTKGKQAEEKIRVASLYSRSLIEASLDPLVTISVDGKITDVNKATELATGCSREELIGSDFSNYFTEPEEAAAGYKQVFTEGFVVDYPLAIRHKSGKVTEVLYNASVYRNVEGQVEGVFAAARDITERKKLEKMLQESERLAAIGSTAGMVGHDIRNPLQAITGDVYLLESEVSSLPEGEAKDNMKESLEGIDQNVQYVNKIVQDLQDYARPITPVVTETNLETLFEDMLKNGVPENIEASLRVEKKAKKIVTDTQLLKRVLSNLVSNSLQAMPNGGKLMVRAFRDVGDTVITVEDTGGGIPENVRSRLFTPLFTTKSKGQGFGLPVVKRMTEALGGTVSFESELEKGTKFIIRLPTPKEMKGK